MTTEFIASLTKSSIQEIEGKGVFEETITITTRGQASHTLLESWGQQRSSSGRVVLPIGRKNASLPIPFEGIGLARRKLSFIPEPTAFDPVRGTLRALP